MTEWDSQSGSESPHRTSSNVRAQISKFVLNYLRQKKQKSVNDKLTIGRNYSAVFQRMRHADIRREFMWEAAEDASKVQREEAPNRPNREFCSQEHLKLKIKVDRKVELKENAFHQNRSQNSHLGKRQTIDRENNRKSSKRTRKGGREAQTKTEQEWRKNIQSGLKLIKTRSGKHQMNPANIKIGLNVAKNVSKEDVRHKMSISEKNDRLGKNPILDFSEIKGKFKQEPIPIQPELTHSESQMILNFEHFDCELDDSNLREQRKSTLAALLNNIQRNFEVTESSVNCVENALIFQKLFLRFCPDSFAHVPLDSKLILVARLWFQLVDDKWHSRTFHSILTKINIKSTKQLAKLTKQ